MHFHLRSNNNLHCYLHLHHYLHFSSKCRFSFIANINVTFAITIILPSHLSLSHLYHHYLLSLTLNDTIVSVSSSLFFHHLLQCYFQSKVYFLVIHYSSTYIYQYYKKYSFKKCPRASISPFFPVATSRNMSPTKTTPTQPSPEIWQTDADLPPPFRIMVLWILVSALWRVPWALLIGRAWRSSISGLRAGNVWWRRRLKLLQEASRTKICFGCWFC